MTEKDGKVSARPATPKRETAAKGEKGEKGEKVISACTVQQPVISARLTIYLDLRLRNIMLLVTSWHSSRQMLKTLILVFSVRQIGAGWFPWHVWHIARYLVRPLLVWVEGHRFIANHFQQY